MVVAQGCGRGLDRRRVSDYSSGRMAIVWSIIPCVRPQMGTIEGESAPNMTKSRNGTWQFAPPSIAASGCSLSSGYDRGASRGSCNELLALHVLARPLKSTGTPQRGIVILFDKYYEFKERESSVLSRIIECGATSDQPNSGG